MNAPRTARDRARAELSQEIKEEARRQLAAEGAQRLSLRAVARALGMASSALYRYFPSRDDLLTALIIDAYDALGAAAEQADGALPRADARGRWRACCAAVRGWALAHPHEYALIYGSPVPGYVAPRETVTPAARVAVVLGGLLADAHANGAARAGRPDGAAREGRGGTGAARQARDGAGPGEALPEPLAGQAAAVAAAIAPGVPAEMMARGLMGWTQLFGMVSLELFGQLVGSADPADAFFGYAAEQMADFMGLPGAGQLLP